MGHNDAGFTRIVRVGATGQCHAFSADTNVATPNGDIPISEVEIGDTVYSYDEITGEVEEHPVVNTFVHDDDQIVYLTIDGEEIETTPWHPFYTDEGWEDAGDLQPGDLILSLDGDYGVVDAVLVENRTDTMYDLTVDVVHTFAVGDGEWVVHNCPPDDDVAEALTRDFAHGGSIESINDIANGGLNESAARTASRGGSVNRPGSFFTVEVTPETFGPIAQDLISFGMRHSETPALVVVQMPRDLFQQLETSGIVETRAWGEHTETIFAPDTFARINQGIQDGTITTRVIDPFKDQR